MVEIPPKPKNVSASVPPNSTNVNHSPLNLGKLGTKKEQTDYLEKRKKLPPLTFALKYITIISLVVLFTGYLWLKFDLDRDNIYLSLAGINDNTQQKYQKLLIQNTKLKNELDSISTKTTDLEKRIAKKQFYEHQPEITEIKSKQKIQWFDEIGSDGKIAFGAFDSFNRMKNFFTSDSYTDIEGNAGVVGGRQLLSRNQIEVKNIIINESVASFTVECGSIFGKVFFLSSEFIDMMNSFSFFKNGVIYNFSRQNLQGKESMSFTLKLDMQKPDEEDPSDKRFKEYIDWEKSKLRRSSSSLHGTRNAHKTRRARPSSQN